ncbi:MAG: DNA repair protein RecO [Candidatus Rokuibacteriota bacterium]|nr:MAG: DNA repair protein RecO [Candidatus Rokubacteria bacterium]PYN11130.1 MAG: DNA repair protein RecO [Candidatus Rokubacteria bacterium]
MGLEKTQAVVIGRRGLGESDRLVTFYSRRFGKIHGVARAARRPRSRFGGALELFTLGELVFFDTGKSDLLRIDHFDIVHPFSRVRDDLDRFGHASWIVECVARLTAEQDRHRALYGLLVRGLRAVETSGRPARAALCFGVRGVEALGHRPRLDVCVGCHRSYPFPQAHLDLDGGGLACAACAREASAALPISAAAVGALDRLRTLSWDEALATPLPGLERELASVLDAHVSRLIGQPTRTRTFLRELQRLTPGGRP